MCLTTVSVEDKQAGTPCTPVVEITLNSPTLTSCSCLQLGSLLWPQQSRDAVVWLVCDAYNAHGIMGIDG